MKLARSDAETYAAWFGCLADPTRILILNLLARQRRSMSVGRIVRAVDVGQSTVSHHLKKLAETGFVLCERRGGQSLYRVNDRCLERFPSAADLVMGRLPRVRRAPRRPSAPWLQEEAVAGGS